MARIVFRDPWDQHTVVEHVVTKTLFSQKTPFQQVDVFETAQFGTVLALGGVINATERDESGYHEMLVHVPLMVHPNPRRVLIIGGGDGGTMREVCRYEAVERATQVEIDEVVVEVCKKYLPETAVGFEHPKCNLIIGDGLEHVRQAADGCYDVILVDSTDPVDAGTVLFTEEFYRECHRVLDDDGILVPQSDSMFNSARNVERVVTQLDQIFDQVHLYRTLVPTYPFSMWNFTFASKGPHPWEDIRGERLSHFEADLRYYTSELHRAAFVLPRWMDEQIAGWRS